MGIPKHKKIYYSPGLISLLILPFVFISQSYKQMQRNTFGVIPIYFADTELYKTYPESFTRFKGSYPPKRSYTEITFTGNDVYNQTKLAFAQIRIREILAQNDSINGLHFMFGDSSTYGIFVKTIDILRKEGAESYMALDNNLWFYHFPPDIPTHGVSCNTFVFWDDVIYIKPKISWQTKLSQEIKQIWKTSWQIIVAFTAFLISMLIFRRKNMVG